MEFSNSRSEEIIYQKDARPSLGRVALKLLLIITKIHARSCLAKP